MIAVGVILAVVGLFLAIFGLGKATESWLNDDFDLLVNLLVAVIGIFLVIASYKIITHSLSRESCISKDYSESVYVQGNWYCVDPGIEPRIEKLESQSE